MKGSRKKKTDFFEKKYKVHPDEHFHGLFNGYVTNDIEKLKNGISTVLGSSSFCQKNREQKYHDAQSYELDI